VGETVTGFIVEAPAHFEHDDYHWCSREQAITMSN
jgi:hypothetical protein